MGLHHHYSSCSCDDTPQVVERVVERVIEREVLPRGNPDPRRFTVLEVEEHGGNVAVKVRYPDATNYEGVKVMVFRGVTEHDIRTAAFLDPHFCESRAHVSPVARFEPTPEGWAMAIGFMRRLK